METKCWLTQWDWSEALEKEHSANNAKKVFSRNTVLQNNHEYTAPAVLTSNI
jgi:hypothetical protein